MDKSEQVVELNMAPEGKVRTALLSAALGVMVSALCYIIARKITDDTLEAAEILLTEDYNIKPKDREL